MNKALIVLDVQYGITSLKDFTAQLGKIETVIADFEQQHEPVIYMKHVDYDQEGSSLFYKNAANLEIIMGTGQYPVMEKSKPSAFSNPELRTWLHEHQVEHVFIVGFNMNIVVCLRQLLRNTKGLR